jgi:hypothetical protein
MSPARARYRPPLVLLLTAVLLLGAPAAAAQAQGPEWRLEQPAPPPPPPGVPGPELPVGLGHVGDVEFLAPNLGLLITAGTGATIPPAVWAYNGAGWHELASVCGATDGRIAWAGSEEFWTVSDGRPGQAASGTGQLPPLEDNTLCHFVGGSLVKSYASLAFSSNSYQAMDAAGCVAPADCWFAGAPLPEPQPGAFELHWNGTSLLAEPNTRAQSIGDMRAFEGHLLQTNSLPLKPASEEQSIEEILHPTVLYEVSPEGTLPQFKGLHPRSAAEATLPEYSGTSFPAALGALRLSADEGSLWAAAGPVAEPPLGSPPGALTVLRDSHGIWSQVLGPEGEGRESLAIVPANLAEDVVTSLAAEPGSTGAWLALDSQNDVLKPSATARALVVRVGAEGAITEEELPTKREREEGVGPKGAASKIACPAAGDCWLVTTQGWLFHLSEPGQRTLPVNPDPAINAPLITFRPPDEGLPQIPSDAPPADTSGLEEQKPVEPAKSEPKPVARAAVPLVSALRSHLLHGSTLELSFHLAVRARVRLLALRRRGVVASTPTRILRAGRRSVLLRLDPRRWPTKLELQTHALAKLPTVPVHVGGGEEVTTTSLAFPRAAGLLGSGPAS